MSKRRVALFLAAGMLGTSTIQSQTTAAAIQSADVRYRSGDIMLAGLLMVPKSERKLPAAVIIQGSGSSDRSNQWASTIAAELVRNGLAVLLTDKRGSGKSEGDWRTVGFSDLADDALAGVQFLRTRPEIDPQRIGLVGLSQGGHVAPLAAARSAAVAFVVNVSGGAVGFAEQSFVEMANTARQAGLSEELVREVIRLNLATAKYVSRGDWPEYARVRERALQTGAREIATGFPASPDDPIWTFFGRAAAYDPMPYWVQVTQPVLVVYGEEDERDNVPVAESVRRLQHGFRAAQKENFRILVVPGAGHGIRDPRTHRLMDSFVAALTAWMREYVTR